MEEIIIDGVDVSGCEQRSDIHKNLLADGAIKEFSNYCYISNDGCYGINCYYKQLKRKEKEYEELKKFCIELEKQKTEQHLQWQQRCTENHLEDTKQIEKLEQVLQKIKKIVNNKVNLEFDITKKLKEIKNIIDGVKK